MYVEITAVGPSETARIALQAGRNGSSLQLDHAGGTRLGNNATAIGRRGTRHRHRAGRHPPGRYRRSSGRGRNVRQPRRGRRRSRRANGCARIGQNESSSDLRLERARCDPAALALGMRRREISGTRSGVHSDGGNSRAAGVSAASGRRNAGENRGQAIGSRFRGRLTPTPHISPWWKSIRKPGGSRFRATRVAHDCGKIVNPMLVEGQIVGGVVQGIGAVLRERLVYDSDRRSSRPGR